MTETTARVRRLPTATPLETVQVVTRLALPLVARGLIVRRPAVTRLVERWDLDRRAVRLVQELRRRHGPGPLRLPVGRRVVLLLEPDQARRVLAETPDPHSPATREKRAALGQFEPHGVLVSDAADRPARRELNEAVLDTGRRVHGDAAALLRPLHAEASALLAAASPGTLAWDDLARAWWRVVRAVVLGEHAREDEEVTDRLKRLRAAGNWSVVGPTRSRERAEFLHVLESHLRRAEPGSLAARWAQAAAEVDDDAVRPVEQVPQWLFAFDAAGIALMRALALLAAHPDAAERARAEVAGRDLATPTDLPFGRACLLEALRLWPTTPGVLRETTRRVRWPDGPVPAGTLVVLYAPLFHRDDERLPNADAFDPDAWATDLPERAAFVPFSAGPAVCAGQDLVLHLTSTFLGLVVRDHDLAPGTPTLVPGALPAFLDPFGAQVRLTPATGAA